MLLQNNFCHSRFFWLTVLGNKSIIVYYNEGNNISKKGSKLNLKYVFVVLYRNFVGDSCLHFCIPSKIVGFEKLNVLIIIGIFMRAMALQAVISLHL